MKVCNVRREVFYTVLQRTLAALRVRPRVMELGVLRGENASTLDTVLSPELMVLVDAWSSAAFVDYANVNSHRPWVSRMDDYSDYFGGRVSEQGTFDRLLKEVEIRFAGAGHVRILRADTRTAALQIRSSALMPRGFELIYVDANHQYETVFDDLMMYAPFVSPNGVLQLNDCCHSDAGVRQNLGVLEAVTRFVKVTDFAPVALTNNDFSDLLLARRGSAVMRELCGVIDRSGIAYVEVPDALLGAARVRGPRGNISFI